MMVFGNKTYIMGILNYTPDSFSDGGLHNTPELAAGYAMLMQQQGADIIDVGCNSTRPGSSILSREGELLRLKEAMAALKGKISVPVSVDTFYSECADYAMSCGASIINDVSGKFNDEIAEIVKEHGGFYSVTHNPCGADKAVKYPNGVVAAVKEFFEYCIQRAEQTGFDKTKLWLDPGFGFGKEIKDNYELLENLSKLKIEGFPILVGMSRKRFVRSGYASKSDFATSAANTIAVCGGADIVRVHNVAAAVEMRRVADELFRKGSNG